MHDSRKDGTSSRSGNSHSHSPRHLHSIESFATISHIWLSLSHFLVACVFFHNPAKGCKNGLRCLFCHFPHAPKKRVRLSKKKRAEAKMLHQESSMPLYSQSNSHTLLETLGSGQHGCQLQESNSTLANCSNGTGSIFLCQQQAAGLNRSDLSSRRNPPSLPLSFLKTYAKRNAYVPSKCLLLVSFEPCTELLLI